MVLLTENHRSHEAIVICASEIVYESKLVPTYPKGHNFFVYHPIINGQEQPFRFHAVYGTERGHESKYNREEVQVVSEYVQELLRVPELEPSEIGIIAPYKEQVYHITNSIRRHPEITVDTVEKFQGSKRRVIIMSTTRTKGLGFVDEIRRFNTAITRARQLLIVVGNPNALVECAFWKTFIHYSVDNNAFRSHNRQNELQWHDYFNCKEYLNDSGVAMQKDFRDDRDYDNRRAYDDRDRDQKNHFDAEPERRPSFDYRENDGYAANAYDDYDRRREDDNPEIRPFFYDVDIRIPRNNNYVPRQVPYIRGVNSGMEPEDFVLESRQPHPDDYDCDRRDATYLVDRHYDTPWHVINPYQRGPSDERGSSSRDVRRDSNSTAEFRPYMDPRLDDQCERTSRNFVYGPRDEPRVLKDDGTVPVARVESPVENRSVSTSETDDRLASSMTKNQRRRAREEEEETTRRMFDDDPYLNRYRKLEDGPNEFGISVRPILDPRIPRDDDDCPRRVPYLRGANSGVLPSAVYPRPRQLQYQHHFADNERRNERREYDSRVDDRRYDRRPSHPPSYDDRRPSPAVYDDPRLSRPPSYDDLRPSRTHSYDDRYAEPAPYPEPRNDRYERLDPRIAASSHTNLRREPPPHASVDEVKPYPPPNIYCQAHSRR